jgi:hypothetical protein
VGPFPYVTSNLRQSEEFVLELQEEAEEEAAIDIVKANHSTENKPNQPKSSEDGSVVLTTMFSKQHNLYLGVTVDAGSGSKFLQYMEEPQVWRMISRPDGTCRLQNRFFGLYLVTQVDNSNNGHGSHPDDPDESTATTTTACENGNKFSKPWQRFHKQPPPPPIRLYLVEDPSYHSRMDLMDTTAGSSSSGGCCSSSWRFEPCLPRAVSSSKIKTFAIGTSIAIGTTVAMPFAMAGVVGLMGAEMSLLTNLVVAGLTGAEALASVGVVGTTAALVFRQDANSISSEVVSEEDGADHESSSKDHHNNHVPKQQQHLGPLCNWRDW